MILCIGTTPAAQRVMIFRELAINQVNRAATTLDGAAGKAVNVAKVLHTLGEQPLATGFLGTARGEEIRAILTGLGLDTDFVSVAAPARQCITVLDQAAHTVTELVEESRPVPSADYELLAGKIQARVAGCQAIIMSGSLTPGGPVDFYRRCTEIGSAAGAMTVLDAQGRPLTAALSARPDLIKPNRAELGLTVGRDLRDLAAVCEAMREVRERGAARVVVTAGHDSILALDGAALWRIQPPCIQPVNPIGSGDAFTAALTWRLLRGDGLGRACQWAAAAGAANALTPMPGELDRRQVDLLLPSTGLEQIQ